MSAALELREHIQGARDALLAAFREAKNTAELREIAAIAGRLMDGEVRAELEVRRNALAVAELGAPIEMRRDLLQGAVLLDDVRDTVPAAPTQAWAG